MGASNRVQHFGNINVTVDGDAYHTRPSDQARDIKKSMYAMSRWLRHIQHKNCHQQGQESGAPRLTCGQIQPVCWVRAQTGAEHLQAGETKGFWEMMPTYLFPCLTRSTQKCGVQQKPGWAEAKISSVLMGQNLMGYSTSSTENALRRAGHPTPERVIRSTYR